MNVRTVRSLILTFSFVLAVISAPPAAAQADRLEGLDDYIESAMADWELPGLAIAVVKDDEVIYARGFGVTELGGSTPVDEHTLFAIASTTKAFTAAALGMLVDQGKMKWDDPVRHHMAAFELADPYVTRHMTVRDLLTHRTGLGRADNVWIASPFDRNEIIRRLRHLPQEDEFRSGYGYNNLMYLTAGELIEAVSDTTWDDFLHARIFHPLNMMRTTTRSAVVDELDNVTASHTRVDGRLTPLYRRNYDALGGAGAIFSSAHDMVQWIRLHLGKGMVEGRRLIRASTIEEMHEPQVIIPIGTSDSTLFPDRHFSAYGLGWRLHDYRGKKVVQHTGWVNYTRTQVGMMPAEGIGMVAFSNATSSSLHTALMYRVFDALLGHPETDWSAKFLAANESDSDDDESVPPRTQGTTPSIDPVRFAGSYVDRLYGDLDVEFEDGRLVLRYSDEYVADLEHWHHDTFRATWRPTGFGSTFATFSLDHEGKVKSMDLRGFTTFERRADGSE